jgi:hypothetical protein
VKRKGGCLFGVVYMEVFADTLCVGMAHKGEQHGCRGRLFLIVARGRDDGMISAPVRYRRCFSPAKAAKFSRLLSAMMFYQGCSRWVFRSRIIASDSASCCCPDLAL